MSFEHCTVYCTEYSVLRLESYVASEFSSDFRAVLHQYILHILHTLHSLHTNSFHATKVITRYQRLVIILISHLLLFQEWSPWEPDGGKVKKDLREE